MTTFNKFGKRLRKMRKARCLTQGELALLTGLEQSRISVLENGHARAINQDTLNRLGGALHCTFSILVKPIY